MRVANGADQDRFVHGPHAIPGADARLAAWITLEPNDFRNRLKALRPHRLLRLPPVAIAQPVVHSSNRQAPL
jgi:hypothetical protein